MNKAEKKEVKPDYSHVTKSLMDEVSWNMMAGETKHGRDNYKYGYRLTTLLAAAERHLKAIQSGEDIDSDTSDIVGRNILHAACVASNMMMLIETRRLGTLIDDRIPDAEFTDNTPKGTGSFFKGGKL
jgi:hypothetical protein